MCERIGIAALAIAVGLSATACDEDTTGPGNGETFEFSFETGLDGWAARGTDLGAPAVDWEIEQTAAEANDGSGSIRLFVDNANDQAKIWIERELNLEPNTTYTVDVTYDFGSSDFAGSDLWTVITGVDLTAPSAAADLEFQGDTDNGEETDAGLVWLAKSYTFTAETDDAGALFVTIGVWGTSADVREYFVDHVEIVAEPEDAGQ